MTTRHLTGQLSVFLGGSFTFEECCCSWSCVNRKNLFSTQLFLLIVLKYFIMLDNEVLCRWFQNRHRQRCHVLTFVYLQEFSILGPETNRSDPQTRIKEDENNNLICEAPCRRFKKTKNVNKPVAIVTPVQECIPLCLSQTCTDRHAVGWRHSPGCV